MGQARLVAGGRSLAEGGLWPPAEEEMLPEELRLLVRQLVSWAARAQPDVPAALQGEEEGILLDLQVDGIRCVLIRRPSSAAVHVETLLSPREREIARMVAKGYPNKVIARVLEISSWTVSTHIRRIFAKLGVSSRAAMVAHLFEEGELVEVSGAGLAGEEEKARAAGVYAGARAPAHRPQSRRIA